MHDKRSTLRSTDGAPICRRSDGKGPNSSRSIPSRSSGTAMISECTAALTSRHHVLAAVLAARRSTVVSAMAASVSSGTARSRWE